MTDLVPEYWNHNVHYQRLILDAVPRDCAAALDVGCGDGLLACRLAQRCTAVTGIDKDAGIVGRARQRAAAGPGTAATLTFVQGDFLTYPFEEASFAFACANTALHHMDFAAALAKLATLLRPGGRLAVVGLGANGSPADLVLGVPGIPVNLWYKRVRGEHNPGAPIMEPDLTWSQIRATARGILPGVRYRRHLLWRYSLLWAKPAA